jgi:L-rhamnose isomerase/sugar isomerase
MAQQLFAKASLVDHAQLAKTQASCDLMAAESCLQDAFATDVRPVLREWRTSKGLPASPLAAFLTSGYLERAATERGSRNLSSVSSYA